MRKTSVLYRLGMYLANILAIAFLILPLVPAVLTAFQTERSIQEDTRALMPRELTLENFKLILSGGTSKGPVFEQINYLPKGVDSFPKSFLNSVLVAVAVTVLTLAIATLSAYTITRLGIRWTSWLMRINLVSRMVPLIVLMIPIYVALRKFELLNSLWGIVIVEVGFLLPYAVIILVPYFASFPKELDDAARLDGCTRFQTFWRIMLPVSTPALAACGVILFIISWHELLIPLIVVSKPEFMTLPVILTSLVGDYFVFFTLLMAICLVGLLPTLILVLVLQKYLVKGLTAGAVKG
jgi:multiple sugar transport system permease protein